MSFNHSSTTWNKEHLILLLVIAAIVILALATAIVFYRQKLARCKASLVR